MKNKLKEIFSTYLDIFPRYLFTMGLILITALIGAVFLDEKSDLALFMTEKGLRFTFLWGVGTYYAETRFREEKSGRWIGLAVAGIIAAILVWLNASDLGLSAFTAANGMKAYAIAVLMLGIWENYRDSGQEFNQYWIRAVYRLAQVCIICGIVAIALALVVSVFVSLILTAEQYELIFRAEFLVMGCLVGWGVLAAQIPSESEPSNFFNILLSLLLGMLLTAFVIVYVYMLRIVITRVVPSNEIFRILAGLFIIGLPIWTLTGTFRGKNRLLRVGDVLPYAFLPFLLLQGYALVTRIQAYGITPSRYLGGMLMLFEVIYIIVFAVRKKETGIMLPIIAVMAVIALVFPMVNMYSVSVRSQMAVIERDAAPDFEELSTEEQSKIAGAFYYLQNDPEGKELLAVMDPLMEAAIRGSGMIGVLDHDRNTYINHLFPNAEVDISPYQKMTWVEAFANEESFDPERAPFYDRYGNIAVEVDLRELITGWIAGADEGEISETIEIPDGGIIQMTDLNLMADENQNILDLRIEGFFLK